MVEFYITYVAIKRAKTYMLITNHLNRNSYTDMKEAVGIYP